MKARQAIIAAVVTLGAFAPGNATAVSDQPVTPAWFEGRFIDLAVDWEGATACSIGPQISVCFQTEAEMDEALNSSDLLRAESAEPIQPFSVCSTSLRLYDGISYTGTVVNFSTRVTFINLSGYGFDNLTSSYKVGGCSVNMYSKASGGGSSYPGNTAANAQSASMSTGWNNLVSSVFIN